MNRFVQIACVGLCALALIGCGGASSSAPVVKTDGGKMGKMEDGKMGKMEDGKMGKMEKMEEKK